MSFFETDIGITLQFFVYNNGQLADLSTATLIQLFVDGVASSPFVLTAIPGTKGLAQYVTKAGDFSAQLPPKISANVRVTFGPNQVFQTKSFQIDVKKLFG